MSFRGEKLKSAEKGSFSDSFVTHCYALGGESYPLYALFVPKADCKNPSASLFQQVDFHIPPMEREIIVTNLIQFETDGKACTAEIDRKLTSIHNPLRFLRDTSCGNRAAGFFAQVLAHFTVSRELILFYWHIGRDIVARQQTEG